jgi:hypothetical protein
MFCEASDLPLLLMMFQQIACFAWKADQQDNLGFSRATRCPCLL